MTTPTPQEVRNASAHMKIFKAHLEGNRFNGLLKDVSQPDQTLRDMEVLIAYADGALEREKRLRDALEHVLFGSGIESWIEGDDGPFSRIAQTCRDALALNGNATP
jgi:hypothetical protein